MFEIFLHKKTRICVDFTFFAAMALFFYIDKNGMGLMSVAACVIHECGHLLALFIEKRDFNSLTFYGGGIKIGYEKKHGASVFLLSAGSILNIVIFIFFYFIFTMQIDLKIFAIINLIIGIFNLLPIKYFDGGQLLEKGLIKKYNAQKAFLILRKTEIITMFIVVIAIILLIMYRQINISALIIMIYVIVSDIIMKIK